MPRSNALGDYLRARRELIRPADVGLPEGSRRRVNGLRREEVAMLAGISPEYYLRLEQGRDLHPSTQVLDNIARALQLDADAVAYLEAVARPTRAARQRPGPVKVSPHVRDLINGWPATAAYVQGRSFTVLAANRLAVAVSPSFSVGSNPLKAAFLDPAMRDLYRDWDEMTAKTVAYLRSVIGSDLDDPRTVALIGELSLRSDRFRALWARHDSRVRSEGLTRLQHPQVGPLDLRFEKLVLPEVAQVIVTYHAEPGSPSEDAFRTLAALAAPTT
jgi:transcriptional regulator with XRE-family HTH domain